jgi:hypothetical protein
MRFIIAVLPLIWVLGGCSEDLHQNPFDSENVRTAGAPLELTLLPGDGQIVISWRGIGLDGVKGYRIYRAFTGDPVPSFEMIAEVPAEVDPATGKEKTVYRYTDSGLQNDPAKDGERLFYIYRVSYVDDNGVETPEPSMPLEPEYEPGMEELPTFWPYAKASPSIPPPPVEVTTGQPQDLRVTLLWTDYLPPDDIAGYRVYGAVVQSKEETPDLKLLHELKYDELYPLRPEEQYFVDTNFKRDKTLKAYKVVAVDKFGVESQSEIFYAESPNLPPPPPKIVKRLFEPRANVYNVTLTWRKSDVEDVAGYRIYSRDPFGGVWELEKTINDPHTTKYKLMGQRYVKGLFFREYTITAFDDTPKDDGSYDESPLPEVPPQSQMPPGGNGG